MDAAEDALQSPELERVVRGNRALQNAITNGMSVRDRVSWPALRDLGGVEIAEVWSAVPAPQSLNPTKKCSGTSAVLQGRGQCFLFPTF